MLCLQNISGILSLKAYLLICSSTNASRIYEKLNWKSIA
jgi:hypothetical protein